MIPKFRIITNGYRYKVQERVFLFFWRTFQTPEDFNNKASGGDESFTTKAEAEKFLAEKERQSKYEEWRPV